MPYAEVAVDAPVAPSRSFSYSIPAHLTVEPGQLVWVPFGRQVLQGVVAELAAAPKVPVTRDILQPVEPSPLVSAVGLDLARWMTDYYRCPWFDALAQFLPPGFKSQLRATLTAAPLDNADLSGLSEAAQAALRQLAASGEMRQGEFLKLLGRSGERELNRLIGQELVFRHAELPRPRLAPRYEGYLLARPGAALESLPPRQQALWEALKAAGRYPLAQANKEFGAGVGDALVEKNLAAQEWVRAETAAPPPAEAAAPLRLTPAQAEALNSITEALDNPDAAPRSFLLHGVTGSGKTEVYLQAMRRVAERGEQAIFLVPEIALTPQTMQRVSQRFPGRVAVIHSRLTPRQLAEQWWRIREGQFDVVVGARSALFAPVPRLGLIALDEEHEWTYKQEDAPPLYHARTAALRLARLTGAVVLMGSATPDVETYYAASIGQHKLLELPQRVSEATGQPDQPLASVEIADMREELRAGNRSIFSRALAQALKDCIAQGQQAILFLNRRGSSTFVQCRDCGEVLTCSRCAVSLTYHAADGRLVCHQCSRRVRMPRRCPRCQSANIRQLGAGTERVAAAAAELLPGAKVERWDADAARAPDAAEAIMGRFASGETQVLVGTQLVAKGLHVPNVTLVGVVLADIGLFIPDFRAAERAFGLLCQVSGRAGRGIEPGRVIVQTYQPEHYAIQAAARQDYGVLYRREIAARREQGTPPFAQLVHIMFQDPDATQCQQAAISFARALRQKLGSGGWTDVAVVGPAPGIPSRLRGRYRWHLLLRGQRLSRFLSEVEVPSNAVVDVDPAHVV